MGDNTILYDSKRDACAPIDVPDINARAYRDADGSVVMFAMHFVKIERCAGPTSRM